MSVNVMGFVYLGLQTGDLAYTLATGKLFAQNQLRYYLDFSLDQASPFPLVHYFTHCSTLHKTLFG